MIQKNIMYLLILFVLQIDLVWGDCPLLLFGNKVEPSPMTYKEDGNLSIFIINLSGNEISQNDSSDNPSCVLDFKLNNVALKNNDFVSITSEDTEGNDIVGIYFNFEYNAETTTLSLIQKEDIPTDVGFELFVKLNVTGQSTSTSPQNGFNISLNGGDPSYNTYTYTTDTQLVANDDQSILIDGDIGGIAIEDITENDTINSVPVTLGDDVFISEINNTTPLIIDSNTGSVKVNAGTLGGLYIATYKLCEIYDTTHCSEANISVSVQNHIPIATDDSISIMEDTRIDIEVLINDTDIDEDMLKVLSVTQPSHGIVVINSLNTAIEYRPDSNYNGFDSFTYVVSDGNGGTDKATVMIEINGTNVAPNASNDYYNTYEEQSILLGVLENDSDTDGDALLIISITQPVHGNVLIDGTNLLYTPVLNYSGEDIFTYTITDGMEHNDSAVVTIDVGSVNDLPTAVDDNITIMQNMDIAIDVLENDSDIESDYFSIVLVTAPDHGKVSIKEDQTVIYTPELDYSGKDTFFYVMADEENATDIGEVNIWVIENISPQVEDDNLTALIGETVTINVLENDQDEENATDISSIEIVGADEAGILMVDGEGIWEVSSEGKIIFTPEENFIGDPSIIAYTVADESGNRSEPATVKIDYIQENPQTVEDSIFASPGMMVVVKVLENDTDEQGDIDVGTLRIVDEENNVTVESLYIEDQGTWSADSYGTITFVPEADLLTSPSPVYYVISDEKGNSSTKTKVQIVYPEVEPILEPTPIVSSLPTTISTPLPSSDTESPVISTLELEEEPVTETCQIVANNDMDVVITSKNGTVIGILFNDTCIEKCGTLRFTQGLYGTVSIDNGGTIDDMTDDVLIYVPNADINNATDSFEYTIIDCNGHSATATVFLRISDIEEKSSSGDTLSYLSMILMIILFGSLGLVYLKEEEEYV